MMAREKRRKDLDTNIQKVAEDEGHTNLAFEATEIENVISKISNLQTLSKNLVDSGEHDEEDKKGRSKKKKKLQSESRIKNDLNEGSGRKKSSKKKTEKRESDEEKVQTKAEKSKKKKKSSGVPKDETEPPTPEQNLDENPLDSELVMAKRLNESDPSDGDRKRVLGVFVHYADCLKLDFHVLHPVVKISLINLSTGKPIPKSDRRKAVTSYYEGDYVTHIIPLMTQPFDFSKRKSVIPRWEELLLFNEDFDYFMSHGTNLGIFFEVVDFVSMSVVNNRAVKSRSDQGGWHRVAWAFLKPIPSKHYNNINRTVRLQLYKPQKSQPKSSEEPTVWFWWSKCPHVPYPSSLYVTIEPVSPPESDPDGMLPLRSMRPNQPEYGSSDLMLNTSPNFDGKAKESQQSSGNLPRVVLWTRLPGQLCKVPDKLIYELDTPSYGARCIKFSADGQRLASGCPQPTGSSSSGVILIHSIATGLLELTLEGHKGPIYDLDWHRDGLLLSASGDCSVRIWSPITGSESQLAVLEHPSYVYAARFHPNGSEIVATGGFDNVVRIWQRHWTNYNILYEFVCHKDYVTCMEFDIDGQVLFSGDHEGAIRVWETQVSRFDQLEDSCASVATVSGPTWNLKKRLDFKEILGCSILSMKVHPGGRRLLVQCRSLSHPVAMVDLKLNAIMQTFNGCQSFRRQVYSCISPCGTYVIASGQDGAVYMWNADNGSLVHVYDKPLGSASTSSQIVVNSIAFHPFDHIIAFAGLHNRSITNNNPNEKVNVCVFKHQTTNSNEKAGDGDTQDHPTETRPNRLKQLALSVIQEGDVTPEKGEKFREVLEKLMKLDAGINEDLQNEDVTR